MSITREQRDEIERLAQNIGDTVTVTHRSHAWGEMHDFLDSLVAEPAEQPYGPLATVAEVQAEEDARLHADDARAAMAALLHPGRRDVDDDELARRAHNCADAMQAERKRR